MILITRPLLEAEELKAKLLDLKINSYCDSLISFQYDDKWINNQNVYNANSIFLFTSIQAVLSIEKSYSLIDYFKNTKIICVGERVSSYLKSKSVESIISIFKDSDQLTLELDFKSLRENSLIYFCGNNYNASLVEQIRSKNIKCEPIVVYNVKTANALKVETQEMIAKNKIQSVALFSQFSTNVFFDLLQRANLADLFRNKEIFCLSEKISMVARSRNFNNTSFPPFPDEQSLLNVIKKSLSED